MMTKPCKILVAALLGAAMVPLADAGCTVPGNAATPFNVGPLHPANGFPEYVRDSNGLALELCLGPSNPTIDPVTGKQISAVGTAPFCFFDPPKAGNAFSQQIGFGLEGFWWLASPDTKSFPANLKAVLVLGSEAAFLADVKPGGQFPFTRLRLRLDVPSIGYYRITEPYGQHVYQVAFLGPGNEINDSFDIEFSPGSVDANGNVTEAVSSNNCVGPWLTWDTYPSDPGLDLNGDGIADFVGDGATSHKVKGSPTGNNLFRIEAFSDAALTVPIDLNGIVPGVALETDLFQVVGKVYDGRLSVPMALKRATYARDALGSIAQLDIFATGKSSALVDFSGVPVMTGPFALVGDGNGGFSTSELLTPDALSVPAQVQLDAVDGTATTDPTHLMADVTDQVIISRAEYDLNSGLLIVEAKSSDTLNPPTLRVVELDLPLVNGQLVVGERSPGVPLTPPGVVTVASSAGGRSTHLVKVIDSADIDNDGIQDIADNCPTVANADQADSDGDGIGNVCDNCILVANGVLAPVGKYALSQRDTNNNGYGNMCDGDIDNSGGIIGLEDYFAFLNEFGKPSGANLPFSENADFDGNGIVGLEDYFVFLNMFAKFPGSSCCGN